MNWQDHGSLQATDSQGGTNRRFAFYSTVYGYERNDVGLGVRIFEPENGVRYNGVVISAVDDNPQFIMDLYNPTANDAAYTASCCMRVLQYDVNQAFHYSLNTPLPTRFG